MNSQEIQSIDMACDAAAAWWVDELGDPKLDNGAMEDPGMAMRIERQAIVNRDTPQPPEALDLFRFLLRVRVSETLEDDGEVFLGVDYDPAGILMECGREAGLLMQLGRWPFKTTMKVTYEKITVSHGYRAPEQVVWEVKAST